MPDFLTLYNEGLNEAFYHDGDYYREPFDLLDDLTDTFMVLGDVLELPN